MLTCSVSKPLPRPAMRIPVLQGADALPWFLLFILHLVCPSFGLAQGGSALLEHTINVPQRPGVYALDVNGRVTEILPEPVRSTRIRGLAGTLFTFGIARMRSEVRLSGEKARFSASMPLRLWIRFDSTTTSLGSAPNAGWMGCQPTSPLEFDLARPVFRKGDRMFVTGRFGLSRQQIGADTEQRVPFDVVQVESSLWALTISGDATGEFVLFRVLQPGSNVPALIYPIGTEGAGPLR